MAMESYTENLRNIQILIEEEKTKEEFFVPYRIYDRNSNHIIPS